MVENIGGAFDSRLMENDWRDLNLEDFRFPMKDQYLELETRSREWDVEIERDGDLTINWLSNE